MPHQVAHFKLDRADRDTSLVSRICPSKFFAPRDPGRAYIVHGCVVVSCFCCVLYHHNQSIECSSRQAESPTARGRARGSTSSRDDGATAQDCGFSEWHYRTAAPSSEITGMTIYNFEYPFVYRPRSTNMSSGCNGKIWSSSTCQNGRPLCCI